MTPRTLNEWTKEKLIELLDKGVFEPELFDFKQIRTERKSEQEKQDIRKDYCAFANSAGGFLVYGIHDDKRRSTTDRLLGIDKAYDFPREIGGFPAECKPSVGWDFLNPPIDIGGGKVVHVIHVPRSWRGPHCVATDRPLEGFVFPKRTNKGNEYMNYEEVRMAFLGYYEKRLKLQLLQAELEHCTRAAKLLRPDVSALDNNIVYGTLSTTVIDSLLADTYVLLHDHPDFISLLNHIRQVANTISDSQRAFDPFNEYVRQAYGNNYVKMHNELLLDNVNQLVGNCESAIAILKGILAA